ncbi:hypothetical protein ACROYT_G002912 [Oculina patagonica]
MLLPCDALPLPKPTRASSKTTQPRSRVLPQPEDTGESSDDEYEMDTPSSPVTHETAFPAEVDTEPMDPQDHCDNEVCADMSDARDQPDPHVDTDGSSVPNSSGLDVTDIALQENDNSDSEDHLEGATRPRRETRPPQILTYSQMGVPEYQRLNPVVNAIQCPQSETYVVINGSQSCWNYNMTFRYNVIALPCLNGSGIDLIDLPWNSDLTSTSAIVSTTPTVPATNKVTIIVPTTPAVRATNKVTIIVPTIIIVAVLAAISMTMFLLYRKKQRSRSDSSRGDADYDAFIIFARDDQKWVDGTLLPILEKEFNYKCCVHYRDFIVGKDFVENMVDSVYTSRKVVAVMSKSFFSSKWCNFELQKAIYKNLNDGIVVIRIDNVSTEKFPKAIKKRSFIDYSNVVERQVFKTRLLKVLGNSNNVV